MRKAYEIKAYAVDGAYKGTLPVSKRISDIRYEIQLNGGQGQTDIELNLPWNDSTYSVGDFLQVYCYDSNSPSGRIIFTGQVGKIVRLTNSGVEKINLSCLGLVALLSQVIFAPGWNYSPTLNQAVGLTVEDAIDHLNATLPTAWLSYSPGDIETWPTANVSFSNATVREVLEKCSGISWFDWLVEPSGKVRFFETSSVSHKPTLEDDVQSVSVDEDGEWIVNRAIVKWASGTVTANDVPSQTAYGVREEFTEDSGINDVWTANARASAILSGKAQPSRKISVTVNGNFLSDGIPTEGIMPGDRFTLQNSSYQISNLKIVRVGYNPEEIRIDLEAFDSFGKEVIS